MAKPKLVSRCTRSLYAVLAAGITLLWGWSSPVIAGTPAVAISQVPVTVSIPAHPQILLAVANSQSMDGDLGGAIWTGAGSLGSAYSTLQASSSPLNYTIPANFTPPANAGSAGLAPYTVNSGGYLLDNSASRLNIAKAAITAILSSYMSSADFALMDYGTSGLTEFNTWVYQMSNSGGFTFSVAPPTSGEYVANPCYNYTTSAPGPVQTDCAALDAFYAGQSISAKPYMSVAASSDDPAINDVLYAASGIDPVCVVYGGPTPPTPYPPYYSIANYNSGTVFETYSSWVAGTNCPRAVQTGPTNAGFVPYSTQVMYEQRGFGFYTLSESANNATTLVTMQSSGATPTAASVAAAIAKFTPYLTPETNSTGTNEIKAAATQAPTAGIIAQAKTFFSGNIPTTTGCPAQRYLVLLTDGLPTLDSSGHAWPPLGSAAATGYGTTATFNADGSLNTTNDEALTDVINQLQQLYNNGNGVKTYIIGLGAGVDPSANPTAAATLKAMAIAGGTGDYFAATSPQSVTSDLQIIINSILAATQSTAAAAVNSTGLNTNSVVYQSQFDTSDSYRDWTGNLYAFPINPTTAAVNTSPSAALWSAQTQLDRQSWDSGRNIATWDPIAATGTPFRWSTGTPATGIATSTLLGRELMTFSSDTNGSDVLEFLRGSAAQEQRNGGQFRNRTHKLGDIVNSNPLYIGAPMGPNQSPSYFAFAAANAGRPPVIYVGADDGMLHAFDAGTGNELFAYLPRGAYQNLVNLASPYYNAVHRFYVNGSPQASDVQFTDNSWHTLLVGTEAQGGNSVFALDVTNPSNIISEAALASSVLWDFTDTDMGLGFSTPAIAATAAGWQVFVGNGYNSPNQKPILYALNPQTGAMTAKIDLCAAVATSLPGACNTGAPNGLSTVVVVNSGGQIAGYANLLYAGDLQGNVWRIDIANADPTQWTVSVLFQARDPSGNVQPITTSTVASLNPRYPRVLGTMVFFGTGQLLGTPDLNNAQLQTIYGVYDPPAPYAAPLTRSSLVQQTLASVPAGSQTVDIVTGNAVTIPTVKGWYIDLSLNPGERVVTDPRLETGGGLVLTTYQPTDSGSSCTVGGNAFLYVINYATGGSFTTPQFDLNGDGQITAADTVTVGSTVYNPVGLALGSVFASAPTIRAANFQTGSAVKLITESNSQIRSVVEKGSSGGRTAWWEIRQ